ncbi:hypothetical protein DIC82_08680 [Clostridium beijerinckii]|nr:hypothetical protein DIC82_08680 [Clostridium beijerinckii]
MKIIKVIHGETDNQLASEKDEFLLNKYDANEFYIKYGSKITKEALEELYIERLQNMIPLNPIPNILKNGAKLVFSEFIKDDLKIELQNIVKETSKLLIDDMKNRSENLEIISLEDARKKYSNTNKLSIGTYTLHPYNSSRLASLEYYHEKLALEKDDELIILLGKMGAKKVRIIESISDKKAANCGVGAKVSNVDGKVNASTSENESSGKELVVTFQGNAVDIDENLLKNSIWFSNDSNLISIFESRRFNPNKIEKYTLKSTYTETFDFNFELATKYLVTKIDLNASYSSISQKERYFEVEFGK